MSLQLIIVVETDSKCKSDWIYVKETIDCFYQYDRTHIKFSPVYMGGKGNYQKKEREIKSLIKKFGNNEKQSKVIYCFDCDDYDSNNVTRRFLSDVQKFCEKNGYDFVWFCRDVEHVFIGQQIEKKQKKKVAERFKEKKSIKDVKLTKIEETKYKNNSSNILKILDKYLERK